MPESFVEVLITCSCGTELQIQCDNSDSGPWSSRIAVICPNCPTEHELKTKPLKYLYKVGNAWQEIPLGP
jgi:hypothetical protein